MLAERPGADEFRAAITSVAHELAGGVKEGLLLPLNLARSFHERWGIKGVLGALGFTGALSVPGLLLTWDIPRGVALTILGLGGGGAINRFERILYGPEVPPSEPLDS